MQQHHSHFLLAMAGIVLFSVLPAVPASAVCNVIPGVMSQFQGTRGTLDRPFASPDDWVDVSLHASCPQSDASATFAPAAADHAVLIAFTPPSGPRSTIVIADCSRLALPACTAPLGAGPCCRPIEPDPERGPDLDLYVRDGQTHLRFRFPDTDPWVGDTTDDLTLTGPAVVAVSRTDVPGVELPLVLASPGGTCLDATDVIACVDGFLTPDGTCTPQVTRGVFASFTALPPPNNYQALCDTPATPCTGSADQVRLTVDAEGNALIPVDWQGVLVRRDNVPVARLLQGSTTVAAFLPAADPIVVPSTVFLGSYSPEGARLPPIFDPQLNPDSDALHLFGTVDAPRGVMRIAANRGTCVGGETAGQACASNVDCPGGTCPSACTGGSNAGATCASASDCPGGVCGRLFEFRDRLIDGIGPMLVTSGDFSASALDPVPLEGLKQTDDVSSFVVSESLADEFLNDDADQTDDVVKLQDRTSGALLAIGGGTAPGRAVVRLRQPPFSFPALDSEGDVVAFLESEPAESHEDLNGNTRPTDAILRVFRVSPTAATSLTSDLVAADAAPRVNGRSLALSSGRVVYRRQEARSALPVTERASVPNLAPGTEANDDSFAAAISGDGKWVGFWSSATNLVSVDTNGFSDVFVRNRSAGTTIRASVGSTQGNGTSTDPALSYDGSRVAFLSLATNLVNGGTNGASGIFLRSNNMTSVATSSNVGSPGTELEFAL